MTTRPLPTAVTPALIEHGLAASGSEYVCELSGVGLSSSRGLESHLPPIIRSLTLSHNPLASFDGLPRVNDVRELRVAHCGLASPLRLEHAKKLEVLRAGGNPLLRDLGSVLGCVFLRVLHVPGCGISSLEGLSRGCLSLAELDASNNPLSSLCGLEAARKLEVLVIAGCGLSSLDGLGGSSGGGLPLLRDVDASHNSLSSTRGLENFPLLSTLDISHNALSSLEVGRGGGDLSPCAFPALVELHMSHNGTLASLPPAHSLTRHFPRLELLDLAHCGLAHSPLPVTAALHPLPTPRISGGMRTSAALQQAAPRASAASTAAAVAAAASAAALRDVLAPLGGLGASLVELFIGGNPCCCCSSGQGDEGGVSSMSWVRPTVLSLLPRVEVMDDAFGGAVLSEEGSVDATAALVAPLGVDSGDSPLAPSPRGGGATAVSRPARPGSAALRSMRPAPAALGGGGTGSSITMMRGGNNNNNSVTPTTLAAAAATGGGGVSGPPRRGLLSGIQSEADVVSSAQGARAAIEALKRGVRARCGASVQAVETAAAADVLEGGGAALLLNEGRMTISGPVGGRYAHILEGEGQVREGGGGGGGGGAALHLQPTPTPVAPLATSSSVRAMGLRAALTFGRGDEGGSGPPSPLGVDLDDSHMGRSGVSVSGANKYMLRAAAARQQGGGRGVGVDADGHV